MGWILPEEPGLPGSAQAPFQCRSWEVGLSAKPHQLWSEQGCSLAGSGVRAEVGDAFSFLQWVPWWGWRGLERGLAGLSE